MTIYEYLCLACEHPFEERNGKRHYKGGLGGIPLDAPDVRRVAHAFDGRTRRTSSS
jgi:hypothetical protein